MKKKAMENEDHEEFEVDEPSEIDDTLQNNGSDDDWTPAVQESVGRRSSGRVKAPKRMIEENSTSEEVSDSEEVKKKKSSRGGGAGRGRGRGRGRGSRGGGGATKRVKTDKEEQEEEENEEEGDETSSESDSGDTPVEFRSGSFVVLKSDFKTGGEHPVWKIDGKSLLQKYVHSKDDDGEPAYKSTTIYAGWSKSAKESYYPIKVETKKQKGKDHIIVFDRGQIKVVEEENENEDEDASENEKEQEEVKETV